MNMTRLFRRTPPPDSSGGAHTARSTRYRIADLPPYVRRDIGFPPEFK